MNSTYTVKINFAHGITHTFENISQEDVEILKNWINGRYAFIHPYEYQNQTFFLNRDYVCSMIISKN